MKTPRPMFLVPALVAVLVAAALPVTAQTDLGKLAGHDRQAALTEHVQTCRQAVSALGQALKARLRQAVADSGALGALALCNVEAVPITERISLEEGVAVGRTSLRVRNPHNAPDPWEREILEQFAHRLDRGESASGIEAWTVQQDSLGHRTFRYMKAIVTGPLCLKCHGSRLRPDVARRIRELYPDDQAVGYHVGDLRGAFTVTKPLD